MEQITFYTKMENEFLKIKRSLIKRIGNFLKTTHFMQGTDYFSNDGEKSCAQ